MRNPEENRGVKTLRAEPGSYRDPGGTVYETSEHIYRSITELSFNEFQTVLASGFLQRLIAEGLLVDLERVGEAALGIVSENARAVLRHPRLSFISYPYEWCFEALKRAALLHLDIQLRALDCDIALVDASAYNVQFVGCRPIFIDHLSFRPYKQGEYWFGYTQFLEQYLNPLLLRALLGVPHNDWYRGRLEGIPTADLNRLMPLYRKLSFKVLCHVTLPVRLQTAATTGHLRATGLVRRTSLPRSSYRGLLVQLRGWIAGLSPQPTPDTRWQRYEQISTYALQELNAKRQFVATFVERTKPRQLWDLGCNTGAFSELALESGAGEVIGFDFDHGALDLAFARSCEKHLRFLPLFLDAANPSPAQGWAGTERKDLPSRGRADALLALAFLHHLVIGRNVPLAKAVAWLTSLAPRGVLEFVPKGDPTVRTMLQLRKDIFLNYTKDGFLNVLSQGARIVKQEIITSTGRVLVWYER